MRRVAGVLSCIAALGCGGPQKHAGGVSTAATDRGDEGDAAVAGGPAPPTVTTGGRGGTAAGAPSPMLPQPGCFDATLLWSEDFETGDYQRWTGGSYGSAWGDECQANAISSEASVSPSRSQRSEVTCPYATGSVHRGYGGLQFEADRVLPHFTNQGTGIDAPNGIVNTLSIRLDTDTAFENGRWVSFLTAQGACDWSDRVLGFGIEDGSGRLAAAHYQPNGGTRTFERNAPSLPRFAWTRITTYLNYHTGVMHVWQDGVSQQHVTFSRPLATICHLHFGLYASANNDDVVLFEDDNSVWKLNEPWTDFDVEPYFGTQIEVCR